MGNSNKSQKYSEHQFEEEVELRKYEEDIGGFTKNFQNILPRICMEKDIISISNVESNILKDYSAAFIEFIQQGYFYKEFEGQKYYDARKLKILLFLLSNDSIIDNSNINYHDKASFIFTFIKTRDDQNLCEGIEENEENFLKFVEDLFEVSCIGIVDSFRRAKRIQIQKESTKFSSIKPVVIKSLVKQLFYNKIEQKSGSLTFTELNKKFDLDKFIFTSGFIRDCAWKILSEGEGNALDEKRKEIELGDIKN